MPLKTEQVDIDTEGRFTVLFNLTYRALPNGIPKSTADEIAATILKTLAGASLKWHQPSQTKLLVATRKAYSFLKDVREPSSEYLDRFDLKIETLDAARKKLMAAAEQLELKKI